MIIYTAGDMHSGWQDALVALLPAGTTVYDPRRSGLSDPAAYTRWDLEHVARADAVIAFMGPENRSGFGLCVEVGYARASGKRVVFVDQLGRDWRSPLFDIVRHTASVVVPTLRDAVEWVLS